MKPSSDSRVRGGVLILALALVGGTGCVVIDAANKNRYERQQRDAEAARQRRIADLAGAGDPAAQTLLAYALLTPSDPRQADAPRALALLEQAAAQDYGVAQAMLGDILAGSVEGFLRVPRGFPPDPRERARGITLLQREATKACFYRPGPGMYSVAPAQRLGQLLGAAGRPGEGLLWRARHILYCGGASARYLAAEVTSTRAKPELRTQALALLTLTGDAKAIAEARTTLPAEDAVAADRLADDLRRQVAASERDFPAPPRKELP
ncbi:hypothetical protein SAMN05428966_11781 [Massilia sp. PDC64]|nr:hypothetical protein [Massilia sp. PDC64]SDF58354.1 hypothetical protein SAMN05428966_11781 [Massilia sp. PDC64]